MVFKDTALGNWLEDNVWGPFKHGFTDDRKHGAFDIDDCSRILRYQLDENDNIVAGLTESGLRVQVDENGERLAEECKEDDSKREEETKLERSTYTVSLAVGGVALLLYVLSSNK